MRPLTFGRPLNNVPTWHVLSQPQFVVHVCFAQGFGVVRVVTFDVTWVISKKTLDRQNPFRTTVQKPMILL